MSSPSTETIFKIISEINLHEARTRKKADTALKAGLIWRLNLALLLLRYGFALLCEAAFRFGAPEWVRWLATGSLLVFYIGGTIYPVLVATLFWKPLKESVRNPFEVFLSNAKITAEADFRYLPELMRASLPDLENVLLEIQTQRDNLERRLGLVVGPVEKIGLFPGLLAAFSLIPKVSTNSNCVDSLVNAVACNCSTCLGRRGCRAA